jgi:putative membrane-bound dehydrogenase-like protein
MNRTFGHLLRLAVLLFLLGTTSANAENPQGLSPEEALAQFKLPAGVQMELVAAEPDVIDPVAIRFDERGQLWVVEMRDYPTGPKPGEPPQSRIRILTDRDGDGRYETATTFAEQLVFPTGLQPWRGGVIVTLSGKIVYLKDTDGDGRADVKEVWYEGFAEQNTQLRANHPRLAANGWVYVANGLKGGKIIDPRRPEQPAVVINGMDFRFQPQTGVCEAVTGNGQFGLTFDDFGRRYVCSNRNPLQQIMVENGPLRRVPQVALPAVMHDVAAAGEASRIFPLSRAWTTSNLHAGQFTAACGCWVYRGTALPAEFHGAGFTCDPTGNLVHAEKLSRPAAAWQGEPAFADRDFLATADEWFRPVNLEEGPDGALYVVDMYRAVIEHPEWVPAELKHRPDERWGDNRGRIYRLRAADRPRESAKLPVKADVSILSSANAWERETAARLLWEEYAANSDWPEKRSAALQSAASEAKTPQARFQSRMMLASTPQGNFPRATWQAWLTDTNAEVREATVSLLAEQTAAETASIRREILQPLLRDPAAAVRFQALLALAPLDSNDELIAAADIVAQQGEDRWFQSALRLAAATKPAELLSICLERHPQSPPELLAQLAESAGHVSSNEALAELCRQIVLSTTAEKAKPTACSQLLAGFAQGLAKRSWSLATGSGSSSAWASADWQAFLARQFAAAEKQLSDERTAEGDAKLAMQLLGWSPDAEQRIERSLTPQLPLSVRLQAIEGLSRTAGIETWQKLIGQIPQSLPAVRRAILDKTLSQPKRVALLLNAIAAGQVRVTELEPTVTTRLLQSPVPELKQRAEQLLASAIPADREEALAKYRPALDTPGDVPRGKLIFRKNCATCHRVGDEGVNVAPDISDSRTKTFAQLLTDIIQPNRAIDANYVAYNVALQDGSVHSGLLSAETATSLTLRQPGDKTLTLLRSDVTELKSSGVSLMPEGLERNITLPEMADLLMFLKHWRYADGRIPLSP